MIGCNQVINPVTGQITNEDIAQLNVLGEEGKALPTRITLLPIKLHDLNRSRINFISFTPGTSFDLKSNLGVAQERVLLYWLLKDIWQFSSTAPMNVFQGDDFYPLKKQ